MYEKLSKSAEGIIKAAHSIAREYDQEYVGTEHVLLAIAREDHGVGAELLDRRGATAKTIKVEVDKLIKHSLEETWVFGRLPGTPHFKNVVATAIEAARELKSREVSTEHLLLALLHEKGSVANNALKNLGINIADVRRELRESNS